MQDTTISPATPLAAANETVEAASTTVEAQEAAAAPAAAEAARAAAEAPKATAPTAAEALEAAAVRHREPEPGTGKKPRPDRPPISLRVNAETGQLRRPGVYAADGSLLTLACDLPINPPPEMAGLSAKRNRPLMGQKYGTSLGDPNTCAVDTMLTLAEVL